MANNPYIPTIDYGNIIGNIPSNIEQGREVARGYQLRAALSKVQPGDFQGMAKALMQYGQPAQGVNAMLLATNLAHQRFEEDLATKTYGLQSEEAKARVAAQNSEINLRLRELQRPYVNVLSGIPAYTQARDAALVPGLGGAAAAAFGAAKGVIRNFAASVADAQGKTGKAAEDFVNNSVPEFSDSVTTKRQKLQALEDQAQSVGILGERVQAGEAKNYIIPPYQPKPPPTGVPGSQTLAPPGPYNPTANVVGPPAAAPEAATADPRGALLPGPGQQQGMNRALAPEQTKITDGKNVFQKINGQWVQIK